MLTLAIMLGDWLRDVTPQRKTGDDDNLEG